MPKPKFKRPTRGPVHPLARGPTTQRVCLRCDKPFASKHVGNRICSWCNKTEAFVGGAL